MAIVSDVEIRLRADIARLQQDMNEARRAVDTGMAGIRKAADMATAALGAIAGVLSVGAFTGWIKGAIDATDALNDLSVRTQISIEDLSALSYAAKISDSSLDGIAASVSKLATNMGKDGDKFRRLGITATEPIEAFKQLSDIFKSIQDPQTRAAFGAEALGKSWQDAAVLLNEGAAGIDVLMEKGARLAGVSTETAAKAGEFNDKLDDLSFIAAGAGKRIAADLLPMLNLLVDDLSESANKAKDAGAAFSPLSETFRALVIFGGNVAFTFKAVGTEIGVIAAQIGQYYSALGQLFSLDPKGAFATLKGAFGAGGIGDMAKVDAEKAREAFEAWQQGWLDVGTAAQKVKEQVAEPFPDPYGIDAKFAEEAAARAVAFLKDSENAAASKKASDDAAASAKRNAEAYKGLIDAIKMKNIEAQREADGLDKLTESQRLTMAFDQMLADGKIKLTTVQQSYYRSLVDALGASEETIKSNAAAAAAAAQVQKAVDELNGSRQKEIEEATREAALAEAAVTNYGLSKSAIEQLTIARMQARLEQRASLDLSEEEVNYLTRMIELRQRGAAATAQVEGMDEAKKAGEELQKYLDPSKAQEFGDTLAKAFGRAGSAMGQLTTTFQAYAAKELAHGKAREALEKKHAGAQRDEKAYAADLAQLEGKRFKEQLGGYGDMAGAAAGFFNEQSKGYKILNTVSQAFHAAELAATIAELVPKGISAILSQGQGDPYTAFARIAAMTALVAGLGVAVGGGGGGGAPPSAASRQKANGTGTVLGDSDAKSESLARALEMVEDNTYRNLSVNYDMLAALRNIESSLSGLGNLIVRGTGISDLAASVKGTESGGFWGGMMKSIFGGKVSVLDTGIKIDPTSIAAAMSGGINASSYVDTKKSGGWFSSGKYRTQFQALGAEVNDQFGKVIMSMADGVKAAGAVLGLSGQAFTDRLNSFQFDLLISLKDLKGDEVQAALEAAFSKLGDDLAKYAVDGLSAFQQVGEGTYETLVRISNNYATVDAVMLSLGKAFGSVGLASVAAREQLIDLSGGLDEFTSQASFFLENFYSDAEKEASLRTAVYQELNKIAGGSAVQSIEQFKALALAQDLTTESGRQTYARLMGVAQAFVDLAKYTEAAKDAADKLAETQAEAAAAQVDALRAAAGEAYSALQRAVNARKTELQREFKDLMDRFGDAIEAQKSKVSKLQALQSALGGAKVGGVDAMQAAGSRSAATAQIAAALALAKSTGYLPNAADLKDALSVVSRDAADQYASFIDYQRDALRTQNNIEELSGITGVQLTTAERTLATLEAQKVATQAAYDAQIARLDGMLTSAQLQIDAINGVNISVMQVAAAFSSFQAAISTAFGNKTIAAGPSAAEGKIEALYQSVFGRASDAGGLAYWAGKMREGTTIDSIRDSFYGSAEYKALQQSSMYSAQQSGTMGGTAALAGALDNLTTRMMGMETAMSNTATSSEKTASLLDRVTAGGNSMLTEPA